MKVFVQYFLMEMSSILVYVEAGLKMLKFSWIFFPVCIAPIANWQVFKSSVLQKIKKYDEDFLEKCRKKLQKYDVDFPERFMEKV